MFERQGNTTRNDTKSKKEKKKKAKRGFDMGEERKIGEKETKKSE
jgi:hypothetical protein